MSIRSEDDAALVERAQRAPAGDLRAFEELVRRHQDGVVTNCRHLTRSPDDAQDLAQDVFIKTYYGLGRFEGRSAFKSWVQRIKINHCLNFIRKRKKVDFTDVEDEALEGAPELSSAPQAEREAMAADDRDRIRAVLDEMPDTLRIPLLLRDMDELSYEEVAETLGIGLSATKMRIKRAREQFRTAYAALEES